MGKLYIYRKVYGKVYMKVYGKVYNIYGKVDRVG
jgi:hypothetical protein